MPRLTFRARLFLALLTVAALSVGVMAVAGVVALQNIPELRLGGNQQEIERLGTAAAELHTALSGVPLSPAGEQALREHGEAMNDFLTRVRNIRGLSKNLTRGGGFPTLLGATAVGLLALVAVLVAVLSRQFSSPLYEVVAWTGRIQRREALPSEEELHKGIPEFAELRHVLRTPPPHCGRGC